MLWQAKHCRSFGRVITSNPLKYGTAIIDDMGHDMNLGMIPGNKVAVEPDFFRFRDWHSLLLEHLAQPHLPVFRESRLRSTLRPQKYSIGSGKVPKGFTLTLERTVC